MSVKGGRLAGFGAVVVVLIVALQGLAMSPSAAATYQVTCSTSGFGCATGGYGPQNLGWPDKYYGQSWQAGLVHNCTRYAAFKLQQNGLGDPGSSFGNAYQWDDRIRARYGADKVNGTPAVGAIAQWDSFPGDGGFGHVAYVEEVGPDYIRVTDDSSGGGTTSKIIPVGHGRWPSSFIHLTGPPPNPDRDGDGTPDTTDRCPDQPGPTNTGGCPDTDSDGVADLDDRCPQMNGLPGLTGCPESEVNPMQGNASDFSGDGKADYCRRVGGTNGVNSFVACTLSTGTGFGKTVLSPVLDWGYDTGRAWVDATGDGKADYCRVVGSTNGQDSKVACTLSTGTGFGTTITSPAIDWGYDTGRAWVDFNGDSKSDYCRRVGGTNGVNSFVACTLSTGTGFGRTVLSPVLDWGYDTGRAWVGHSIQSPSQPSPPGPVPVPSDPGSPGPEPVSPTPPGGTRQQSIRIKAKPVKKASRLAINASPDRPRIRIQIRQRTSGGRLKVLMTRTLQPPHNTKIVNVGPGFYRVFAPSQKNLTAGKSRVVRIRR